MGKERCYIHLIMIETNPSEDIDFFSLPFVLIEEKKFFPPSLSSKLTNFFFSKCTFNKRPTNRTQQEEGRKWVGDEIDAMTDNILSTHFPPGKASSLEKK